MILKKDGMPERNYMSHSSGVCFGKRSDQVYLKWVLGGILVNRVKAFKQFLRVKKNWKRGLKYFKKQNKIIYNMARRTISRR